MVWLFSLLLALTAAVLAAALPGNSLSDELFMERPISSSSGEFPSIEAAVDCKSGQDGETRTLLHSFNLLPDSDIDYDTDVVIECVTIEELNKRIIKHFESIPDYSKEMLVLSDWYYPSSNTTFSVSKFISLNEDYYFPEINGRKHNVLYPSMVDIDNFGRSTSLYTLPDRLLMKALKEYNAFYTLNQVNKLKDFTKLELFENIYEDDMFGLILFFYDLANSVVSLWEGGSILSTIEDCIIVAEFEANHMGELRPSTLYRAFITAEPKCISPLLSDDMKEQNAIDIFKAVKLMLGGNKQGESLLYTILLKMNLSAPEWTRFYNVYSRAHFVRDLYTVSENKYFRIKNSLELDTLPSDIRFGNSTDEAYRNLGILELSHFITYSNSHFSLINLGMSTLSCYVEPSDNTTIHNINPSISNKVSSLNLQNIQLPTLFQKMPFGTLTCFEFVGSQDNLVTFSRNLNPDYNIQLGRIAADLIRLAEFGIFYNLLELPMEMIQFIKSDGNLKLVLTEHAFPSKELTEADLAVKRKNYLENVLPLNIIFMYLSIRGVVNEFNVALILQKDLKETSKERFGILNRFLRYLDDYENIFIEQLLDMTEYNCEEVLSLSMVNLNMKERTLSICENLNNELLHECLIFQELLSSTPSFSYHDLLSDTPILSVDYAISLATRLINFYGLNNRGYFARLKILGDGSYVLKHYHMNLPMYDDLNLSSSSLAFVSFNRDLFSLGIVGLNPKIVPPCALVSDFVPILAESKFYTNDFDEKLQPFINKLKSISHPTSNLVSGLKNLSHKNEQDRVRYFEKIASINVLAYLNSLALNIDRNLDVVEIDHIEDLPGLELIYSCIESVVLSNNQILSRLKCHEIPVLDNILKHIETQIPKQTREKSNLLASILN